MPAHDEVKNTLKGSASGFMLPESLRERNLVKDRKRLTFSKTTGNQEALRCCFPVGHDLQSGHIYCGKPASYHTAEVELLGLCRQHPPFRLSES